MSTLDAASGTDNQADLWHVQVAAGDLRTMSLDELDSAFQDGVINEGTYVRHDGADTWAQLGQVLGSDDAEAPLHEPHAADLDTIPAPPAASEPPIAVAPLAAAPAPVTALAFAPPSSAYEMRVSAPPASFGGPLSTSPMVAPISYSDIEIPNMRSSKRGVFVALGAVLVLAIGAVAVTRTGTSAEAAAGSLAPTSLGASVGAAGAAVAPVAPVALPESQLQPGRDGRLSDDQRRALLDADKLRASKVKPASPSTSKSQHRGPAPSTGPVFHKGGDQHDPLNSSL